MAESETERVPARNGGASVVEDFAPFPVQASSSVLDLSQSQTCRTNSPSPSPSRTSRSPSASGSTHSSLLQRTSSLSKFGHSPPPPVLSSSPDAFATLRGTRGTTLSRQPSSLSGEDVRPPSPSPFSSFDARPHRNPARDRDRAAQAGGEPGQGAGAGAGGQHAHASREDVRISTSPYLPTSTAMDPDLTSAFFPSPVPPSTLSADTSSSLFTDNAPSSPPSHGPTPPFPTSNSFQTLSSQPSFFLESRASSFSNLPQTSTMPLSASVSSLTAIGSTRVPVVSPLPSPTRLVPPNPPPSSTAGPPTVIGRPSPAAPPTPVGSQSSSSRRAEPVLPSANVPRAPPTAMYWSKMPAGGRLTKGMRAHSATVVGSDVWCFGGCDIRGNCFKDVWKFDVDAFNWTKPKVIGECPPITRAHTAVLVDKRIFIIGGGDGPTYYNETYYFDTVSLTWCKPTIFGTPPTRRRAHTAVLYDHKIIVFGGGNGSNALNDVHALDVSDLRHLEWRLVETHGKKPIARGYHSMNLVGSKCVVFGGSDGTECFSDVHILDLQKMSWSEVKPEAGTPAYPRLSHTATCVGSYLFIIGGHDGVNFSSDVLLFNLVTLSWETRNSYGKPPSARGYHATVLYDSRVLVLGGFDGHNVFDAAHCLELGGSAFLPQITNFVVINPEEDDEEEGEERER